MPVSPVPLPFRSLAAADLLGDLLAVSLTGIIYYTPLYDPAGSGEIIDFTFEYLNPAAQRMMRMPERPTLTHKQQWPHSVAHGTFAFHVEAYLTGEPREYNINYQADGYDNYYRLAARRSGDGLLVSFTDTADQPRSPVEVALREAQAAEKVARADAETQRQRFHEVLMQLPAYVAVYQGPDHIYQFVNPPYQRLFPHRSFAGRPFREGIPEASGLGVAALFDRVYQTGEPYYIHEMEGWFDFRGTDQPEQVFLNLYLHPLRNPQGHIDGILDFSYDVTEQVRARQQVEQLNQDLETRVQERTAALQESESRFRIMADAAPNQVWAVNPDSTIRYANQAFLDFVGVGLEQYVATGWSAYLHPEELELAQTTLEAAIRTRTLYVLEHRMLRHDGQYRWLLAQGAPSFYPNGELYGYVGSAIDITDLKQTNQQLTRTNVDLDNFIYTASHDLRAPITNIEGLLRALTEQLPPETLQLDLVQPILDRMQGAVDRFKRTIEHLTDVSKLQQEYAQSTEQVLLADVVDDVRQDLLPLLRETQGRLDVDVAACPPVSFSPKNLRSVVYNLLSNALKYRDPARPLRVRISCRYEAGQLRLQVQDNGLGLDESQHSKVFGMFQRLHTHVEGSGIGLYMVKRIAENAGGHVSIQSQLGIGTTFTVVLPAQP